LRKKARFSLLAKPLKDPYDVTLLATPSNSYHPPKKEGITPFSRTPPKRGIEMQSFCIPSSSVAFLLFFKPLFLGCFWSKHLVFWPIAQGYFVPRERKYFSEEKGTSRGRHHFFWLFNFSVHDSL
ncbi:MAG: hypothetical protein Q4G11_06670, partial [Gallicola sp.]|nr:hypothetical protein [Gallicola sp.]